MTDLRKILAEATPGPWKTHLVDDTTIIATDGTDVATTCDSANVERSDAYNVESERMEADARLIALTPQLAAALIKAREGLAEIGRQKRTDELVTEYDVEVADFEAGYDLCVDRARATLAEIDALMGGDGD